MPKLGDVEILALTLLKKASLFESPARRCLTWWHLWLIFFPVSSDFAASAISAADVPPTAQQVEFFEQKIRPLLAEHCLDCHSHQKKIKGGLALDSRPGWLKGGDTGRPIEPGDPDASLLIKAVRYKDADLQMPPHGKLKDAEIALLEQWVKAGAPDPRTEAQDKTATKGFDPEAARRHWAYQPLQAVAAPDVRDAAWPLGNIDRFVLAKLEAQGWSHSPDSSRAALLRRASLDLTGLPPTAAEVESFLADSTADPYAAAVDRLLASRAYGERWARAWLDLVGYADQIGSANNVPAEEAWRYRDYLIESFHRDKPYDMLIREQLAGDLLAAESIEQRRDQLTATGFLVLGNVNIVDSDKLLMKMDLVDRQLEKIGKTFLGMTLHCVRCHDHKFDPITQQDYYGLAGILASTDATYKIERGIWSSVVKVPLPETLSEFTAREAALRAHEKKLAALQRDRTETELKLSAVAAAIPTSPEQADGLLAGTKTKSELEQEQKTLQGKLSELQRAQWHLNYLAPKPPAALGVTDSPHIADTNIQVRGNPHVLGAAVPRGFVQVATHGPAPAIPADQSGRKELAEWLIGPARPLVARTAVNRVWEKLFGRGIVNSTDYFGLRSDPPSHPELLDFLSQKFIDEGWSYKKLVRQIVLSRTYRQSSDATPATQAAAAADPDNIWLWRMNPRRLEAEMLRDAALLVSGNLRPCDGGPALSPEFRENVGGLDPKDVNPINFSLRKFRDDQAFVRTVYLPVVRSSDQQGPADVLNFFDFTQPAQMTGTRTTTAVSSQALFLLNSPLCQDASRKLAEEIRTSPHFKTDSERIAAVWLRVLNRPVAVEEISVAADFLAANIDGPESAWQQLVHGLLLSNEFLFRL